MNGQLHYATVTREGYLYAWSTPGKAAFDVRVASDAPVGLFGLRVATAAGLSNVHLCLIDDLPGVEESAVVGLPHHDFGEAVTAFIVTKPDAAP